MSLAKLPFLSCGLVATYVLMSAPQPKVPVDKISKDVNPYERFFSAVASKLVVTARAIASAPIILEGAVIIASRYPSSPFSQTILRNLVLGPPGLAEGIALSRSFLIGWCLGVLGTTLRYQCYRALGRSFTLELTVRDEQKLVTDGPYSYVRHPSYTTGIMGGLGLTLTHVAQGSWLEECGVLQTPIGKTIRAVYLAVGIWVCLSILWRTPGEDEMLRKHFGKEWEEYAKKVPYRLIPYVY